MTSKDLQKKVADLTRGIKLFNDAIPALVTRRDYLNRTLKDPEWCRNNFRRVGLKSPCCPSRANKEKYCFDPQRRMLEEYKAKGRDLANIRSNIAKMNRDLAMYKKQYQTQLKAENERKRRQSVAEAEAKKTLAKQGIDFEAERVEAKGKAQGHIITATNVSKAEAEAIKREREALIDEKERLLEEQTKSIKKDADAKVDEKQKLTKTMAVVGVSVAVVILVIGVMFAMFKFKK